ncbi:MAG: hypothetical protein IJ920_00740 [Paludibacteraceae bacterium]|nr:hypothetical protein [Paludibacteraceae bacterium]
MKHVIYHTDYYDHAGNILRDEECDAYFNTLPDDDSESMEKFPPNGCRLLELKIVPDRLTKEQWESLMAKQPDYQLRYASLFDTDEGYAIYAIYERLCEDDELQKMYMGCIAFGQNDDVTLDMCVVPLDYELGDEHVTQWDEVEEKEGETVKTENSIRIVSCADPEKDRQIRVYYGGWTISGKWDLMEQVRPYVYVYHCHNALFRFDVTFSLERDAWDGNYESLLHD